MLSHRIPLRRRTRALAVAGGLLLAVPLIGVSTPAGAAPGDKAPIDTAPAAPGDTAPSAAGDVGLPRDEFLENAAGFDENIGVDVEGRPDACRQVGGDVTLADALDFVDQHGRPRVKGRFEYQLCAGSAAEAARIAAEQGTVENMKRFCSPDAVPRNACTVFVHFRPAIEQRPPINVDEREDFFEGFLEFAPELRTSPSRDLPTGLIVNFPIWFWDDFPTFPKPIFLPFFGGITGLAFHLETTWDTDGERICDDPGTIYRPGRHRPDQESPDCGHVYDTIGTYEVHGEKDWLIIAQLGDLFPIPIVFELTFTQDFTVPVKEVQVLGGGDPRRAPVR